MFKYKYEKILSIKADNEEEYKLKLAQAIAYKEEVENRLLRMSSQYEAFIQKMYSDFQEGVKVAVHDFILMNKRYYKEQIRSLEYELYKADEKVNKSRLELLEATKEKKKYEKLKERALNEYISKLERAEAQMLEEFVSNKVTNSKGDMTR